MATLATVVASQALISGGCSLTQQCVRLHDRPRVSLVHTSRVEPGQIYIPEVNTALMTGCLLLVLGFESSSALGAAYGVAVTGTMAITTMLSYVIARQRWHWSALRAGTLTGMFLAVGLAFFGANIIKIAGGGWVPPVIAGSGFLLMTTWHRGTGLLHGFLSHAAVPMDRFLEEVQRTQPRRVRGTAVFLTPDIDGASLVLQRHLRHRRATTAPRSERRAHGRATTDAMTAVRTLPASGATAAQGVQGRGDWGGTGRSGRSLADRPRCSTACSGPWGVTRARRSRSVTRPRAGRTRTSRRCRR